MTATVTEINEITETPESKATPEQLQKPAMERVKITVTGVRTGKNITQELELDRPQGDVNGNSLAYVWERIRALGGLVVDGGKDSVTFYPLASFENISIEVGEVSGVTL